ncbi:hypothetical protein, partial [Prevotella heparinolytica]|uniref:hypothetical protein n=1 Tax=Prevotella heparinolytica TaxID=28113 RepID=UPI001BE11E08
MHHNVRAQRVRGVRLQTVKCGVTEAEVRAYGCGVADDASGLFSKLIYSHNVTKNKRDYQLLLPFSYPELT